MTKDWQCIRWRRRKLTSVVPIDDLQPHVADSEFCACQPEREHQGRWTHLVHNSFDGRELVERHGLQ